MVKFACWQYHREDQKFFCSTSRGVVSQCLNVFTSSKAVHSHISSYSIYRRHLCTWPYFTLLYISLPWLYFILHYSTFLYHGSTSLYFTLHISVVYYLYDYAFGVSFKQNFSLSSFPSCSSPRNSTDLIMASQVGGGFVRFSHVSSISIRQLRGSRQFTSIVSRVSFGRLSKIPSVFHLSATLW